MRNVKFYLLLLILNFSYYSLFAYHKSEEFPPLTRNAQISLITGEPGEELYTKFGHSAIRVHDPAKGIDLVYNYGTFDFDAPGFYPNFLRGKLIYSLSVYDFKRMVYAYKYFNQSLFEQVLSLSYEEKKAAYDFLNNNYLPENRYYLYDFFFDNCSSRIKDVFQDILGPDLVFEDAHIKEYKSFRQLLDEFLEDSQWIDFGIDLLLGMPTDATATSEEYMFLPYKLYNAFDNAMIRRGSEYVSLVISTVVINQSINIPGNNSFVITPKILFWSLFIIVTGLTLIYGRKIFLNKVIDTTLFISVGLTGIVIFLLWFATDHLATRDNLNLLWAFPPHLILPYFILKNSRSKWMKFYFMFWMFFLILFMSLWTILPQQLNLANIPILMMLVIRFYFNYKRYNSYVEGRK
jgi:hypothetical protein